jgi:hypothetical protein
MGIKAPRTGPFWWAMPTLPANRLRDGAGDSIYKMCAMAWNPPLGASYSFLQPFSGWPQQRPTSGRLLQENTDLAGFAYQGVGSLYAGCGFRPDPEEVLGTRIES